MSRMTAHEFGVKPSNTLGVAGFICSLCGVIGFVVPPGGMLLSLVGFVLSLIALGTSPRGFAIAGVILGFIGMGCVTGAVMMGGVMALLALIGIGVGVGAVAMEAQAQVQAAQNDLRVMDQAIAMHYQNHDSYPTNLGALVPEYLSGTFAPGRSMLSDPWGKPYVYEVDEDGRGFMVKSSGPDMNLGTPDDLSWRRSMGDRVETRIESDGVESPRPRID
jgi:general secretion pathway protein G